MLQTGGPPVLHRVTIVKLLTQHVRRLLGTHQRQSALLVVGLPVTQDWFEMGCHLFSSLIPIRLTASRERGGVNKQTNKQKNTLFYSFGTTVTNLGTLNELISIREIENAIDSLETESGSASIRPIAAINYTIDHLFTEEHGKF